jgi:hypothetical protein
MRSSMRLRYSFFPSNTTKGIRSSCSSFVKSEKMRVKDIFPMGLSKGQHSACRQILKAYRETKKHKHGTSMWVSEVLIIERQTDDQKPRATVGQINHFRGVTLDDMLSDLDSLQNIHIRDQ